MIPERPLVRPTSIYLPTAEYAPKVAVVPKSSVPAGYWQTLEATNPYSFELVMRDFIPSEGASPDMATPVGRARLDMMIARGVYEYHSEPAYYVYRVDDGYRTQTGIVGEVEAAAYDRGLIKRHEHTRPEAEAALVNALRQMQANSYPMCMTYRHAGINALIDRLTAEEPILDFLGQDGVQQSVWKVRGSETEDELEGCLHNIEALYITDGHHRAAAGAALARATAAIHPDATGLESFNYVMGVIYPSQQLKLVEYNRCVTDLGGLTDVEFVQRVSERMTVDRLHVDDPDAARPERPGTFGMFVGDKWYRLTVPDGLLAGDDPYGGLDVVLLNNLILGPILGISDPRTSERLEYIPGTVPLDYIATEGSCGAFFLVHPTKMAQVAAVADQGLVMPPKSTWFLPKISSGLFIRLFD
ncbi:MAG: DUF1015 family protein [Acidimicrobiia bacterium]|nr:DUF1015 family protein [Acidimicrobiia bacterium]